MENKWLQLGNIVVTIPSRSRAGKKLNAITSVVNKGGSIARFAWIYSEEWQESMNTFIRNVRCTADREIQKELESLTAELKIEVKTLLAFEKTVEHNKIKHDNELRLCEVESSILPKTSTGIKMDDVTNLAELPPMPSLPGTSNPT